MSKTPSPGQSLDLVSEGRRRGKRGREDEKGGEGKKGKEEEERITVISITPQPMVTTRPLPAPIAPQPAAKKSNLRTASRCQIFPSRSPSVMFLPPHIRLSSPGNRNRRPLLPQNTRGGRRRRSMMMRRRGASIRLKTSRERYRGAERRRGRMLDKIGI